MNVNSEPLLLAMHALVTAMLAGLIWCIQIVHYPLFQYVGREAFVDYEREHVKRITWVVGPLMLAELTAAIALLFMLDLSGRSALLMWIGFALLVLIWLSTFVIQTPLHCQLEAGCDDRAVRRLIVTNWFRTLAWSARAVIAIWLLM